MKCPSCGADAAGKFCSNCGAALAGASCATCNAPLTAGARFCHVCGTPLGAPRRTAARNQMVPWIVAAVAVAVLVVVFVARSSGPSSSIAGERGGGGASSSIPGAGPGGAGTTDLSTMTPREQADRLFNRVMSASENGNSQEVTFFGPMALQAYGMLGQLDPDARYHVGLIEMATGNPAGALTQADTLDREAPRHLFAPLLRWEVASKASDTAALRRAYRQFLDNYDREIATRKPEYADHQKRLEAFRNEASGALGSSR